MNTVGTVRKSTREIRQNKGRIDRKKIVSLTDSDRERFKREELVSDEDFGLPRMAAPQVEIRKLREHLGLSQDEFANRYLLPRRTLQEWEQHRREPSEPARVLLFAISRDPRGLEKALRRSRKR